MIKTTTDNITISLQPPTQEYAPSPTFENISIEIYVYGAAQLEEKA